MLHSYDIEKTAKLVTYLHVNESHKWNVENTDTSIKFNQCGIYDLDNSGCNYVSCDFTISLNQSSFSTKHTDWVNKCGLGSLYVTYRKYHMIRDEPLL